jgi:hypothetical protein
VVTIPAFVWRGGFARRAVTVGMGFGACVGILGWLDSGVPAVGALVFLVVGTVYGVWMARRMDRYWPGSVDLTGDERVTVVSAARRGERLADARLVTSVADYSRGLHAAAAAARPIRWLIGVVLVVAVGTAVWDSMNGSWGNVVASVLYLVALVLEVLWWPKRSNVLLNNAHSAARECH